MAHIRGYETCGQKAVAIDPIITQIADFFTVFEIPEDAYDRVAQAVSTHLEEKTAFQRMNELQMLIQSVDFDWEKGLLDRQTYMENGLSWNRS